MSGRVLDKNGFGTGGRFMIVGCFCAVEKKRFDPKVPQKCLGGVWDHPRPILDHSGPILTKNRLTTEITQNNITNPIKFPIQIPHSYLLCRLLCIMT